MSEHDFTINLKINRAQADASAKAAIAAAKAIEQAHKQTADTEEKTQKRLLTDAEITERSKQKFIADTNRIKINAASTALKADRDAADAAVKAGEAATRAAHEVARVGDTGTNSMTKMGVAMALTQAGLQKLGELARAFGSGLESAAKKADDLSGKFGGDRRRLAELASLEGRKLDNKYTVDFARFQEKTGATADEALAFRTEFMNSGAQFIGKNISESGAGKLKEQALQFALARGLDPRVVGDLTGNLLGFKDWEKEFGANAPQEILGSASKSIQGVQRGRGDTGTLIKNMTSLMAQTLNEDELKGTFQKPEDVAALISLMAESKPDEAETMGRASLRALRAFGDSKMGPLLGEAGVTPKTGFRGSAEAVGKKLQDISKAEGIPVQDVIARYTSEEREKIALATIVNKGIGPGGVLADRDAYMKQFTGESALADIGQFRNSEEGATRFAEAGDRVADAEKARGLANLDVLNKQARTELKQEGKIDTTSSEIQKQLLNIVSFGFIPDADRVNINLKTAEIVNRRAVAAGFDNSISGAAGQFGELGVRNLDRPTVEGRAEQINKVVDEITAAGGNPFGDFLPAMNKNTKALERNSDLMEKDGAGGAPRPMARPNPNPANRVP